MRVGRKLTISIVSFIIVFTLICFYASKTVRFWQYCNDFWSNQFNPKCKLAADMGIKYELNNPNITYKDATLAIDQIKSIIAKSDARLDTELPVDAWPIFTHSGNYTIKYHPSLKPTVFLSESSEFPDSVRFTVIGAEDQINDFYISISFNGGGGGSLCANAICYNARALGGLEPIKIENAYLIYGNGGEERLRDYNSDKISFGLSFEPTINAKFIGRISSRYGTGNQREVIKQMLETLELKFLKHT